MYTAVADFLADWQNESQATAKVLANLTDESLRQRVTPEGRTLGRLAWHIVQTLTEMPHTAGILPTHDMEHVAEPTRAAEFVEHYKRLAQQVHDAVAARWTDDQLRDEVPMYGEQWAKRTVLSVLIRHEAHHRGQMTVLMRQAGLRVPGVYGPSREEWAEYGMPALA